MSTLAHAALSPATDPALRLTTEPPIEPAPVYTYRPLPPTAQQMSSPLYTPPKPLPALATYTFAPPEDIAAQIIQDLCRPDACLAIIAQNASTTIEAVTLWMSRPDIAARLDAFEAGAARQLRMAITNTMHAVVDGLGRIIREFHESESDVGQTVTPATPTTIALASCRNRTTFIDASKLLLRIRAAHTAERRGPRGMGVPAHVSGASPEVVVSTPASQPSPQIPKRPTRPAVSAPLPTRPAATLIAASGSTQLPHSKISNLKSQI